MADIEPWCSALLPLRLRRFERSPPAASYRPIALDGVTSVFRSNQAASSQRRNTGASARLAVR